MSMIQVGNKYQFCYPLEFRTLPLHRAHSGQTVTVVKYVPSDADVDSDLETLWLVQASDGWQGEAFESELAEID